MGVAFQFFLNANALETYSNGGNLLASINVEAINSSRYEHIQKICERRFPATVDTVTSTVLK